MIVMIRLIVIDYVLFIHMIRRRVIMLMIMMIMGADDRMGSDRRSRHSSHGIAWLQHCWSMWDCIVRWWVGGGMLDRQGGGPAGQAIGWRHELILGDQRTSSEGS